MLLSLLLLAAADPSLCAASPSSPIALMDQRWRLLAPPGASESHGQVTIRQGETAILVQGHELYATAPRSLAESVDALARAQGQETLIERASLPGGNIELVMPRARPNELGPLVMAYVRHPDGLVQRLDFSTSNLLAERVACVALVKAMLGTLQPGPRPVAQHAGPRTALTLADGSAVVVTVPAGFSVVTVGARVGIRPIAPLERVAPEAVIHVGATPLIMPRPTQDAPPTQHPSQAFATRITWQRWQSGDRFFEEAVIPYPAMRGPRQVVHLFTSSSSDEERTRLRMILETCVLARPRGAR